MNVCNKTIKRKKNIRENNFRIKKKLRIEMLGK